jgi:hypothetical protein
VRIGGSFCHNLQCGLARVFTFSFCPNNAAFGGFLFDVKMVRDIYKSKRLLVGAIPSDESFKSKEIFPLNAGVRTVFLTTDKCKK